jgi:import inner membrane translocase subunit TIM54
VAAAIDYEMVSCPQYGSLARHVSDHILIQRRQELSTKYNLSPPLEPPTLNLMAGAPGQLSPEEKERRRVEGGAIVIGRNTLKEYMAGLRKGYMEGIKRETREKVVEREIEGDGIFETKEELEARRMEFEENARKLAQGQIVTPPATAPPKLGGLSFMNRPTPVTPTPPTLPLPTITDQESLIPSHAHLPPSPLPEQPCMLLVPWTNHLGFKQIPYMIWDLFNERAKYRIGGEAGMRLVFGHKREFIGKDKEQGFRSAQGSEGGEKMLQDLAGQAQSLNNDFNGSAITTTTTTTTTTGAPSDLDFDLESEDYYKKGFGETLSKITKARESYYTELKTRLQTARDLANGVREATTEEQTKPPPTETELREERLKRELRWRNEELGYEIVHKGSDVSWTPRWDGWLKVYDDVTSGDIPVPASKTQEANW